MPDASHIVYLYGEPAGRLSIRGSVTTFEFFESYLDTPTRPVLGQSFEEEPRGRWRQAHRVPAWFSNLLPEGGPLLDFIASQLEISPRSEARLLLALGNDLPGAVAIGTNEGIPATEPVRFEQISNQASNLISEPAIRFSVAGIQLKLSMVREHNVLRLAGKAELGGHYVKFPGRYSDIPANEFAMMIMASNCGITVPSVELVRGDVLGPLPSGLDAFRDRDVYVVKRFDRTPSGPVHIEDFNQVLGNWPDQKYQGASYESLGRVVLAVCGTDDFLEYVRRLAFNIAIGNEDAHLKNWSLIYPDRVHARLSPAYDLVSTIQYADLTREMALRLGETRRASTADVSTFRRLARKAGGDEDGVEAAVVEVLTGLRDAEEYARERSGLPASFWERLHDYQASVSLCKRL